MEGVIDPVMRQLMGQIGGYDLFVTEFIRITQTLLPEKVFFRYCPELKNQSRTLDGTPVFVQLLGSDCQALIENALRAVELGSLGIDMNFGCPAKTVNRHDGGASLLKTPYRIEKILTSLRKALPRSVPLTAKIRLGFEDKALFKNIIEAIDASDCQHITIHARTKKEGYTPPAHWHVIKEAHSYTKIPLIANGDIWSLNDYKAAVAASGCTSVALGRGGFARPDLAKQIQNYLKNQPYHAIEETELLSTFVPLFLQLSKNFKNNHYALTRLKQWSKFLSRNYPMFKNLFANIKRCQTLDEINFIK
jgi:tRNA-dihydrouridine synthase C